jgi:hypothetical protein
MTHHHDYVIISETDNAIVEVGKECKKRLVTRKGEKGSIDNKRWLREHVRDTAQPSGITGKIFERYYGYSAPDKSD